ncbi:MAG: cytochrome c-type biogenesis protein CcmH [Betaproteobacteria bacterium]|nr:cytochrome c-type biogenesis protein CcmH [Betaproteobacteria bacterium]
MTALRIFAFVGAVLTSIAFAQAPSQPLPPISPELEQRLKVLETELRCLVCQNQTLADSPAGLADDLRREIRGLALAGKTNAEIKDFLQTRYGDFILYRPPVKSSTWLLWVGPFALLLVGGVVFMLVVRRRGRGGDEGPGGGGSVPAPHDAERVRKLLDE